MTAHFNKVCRGHTQLHTPGQRQHLAADKCRIKAVPVKHSSSRPTLAYLVNAPAKFAKTKFWLKGRGQIIKLNTSFVSLSFSNIISDTRFWHLSVGIVEGTKSYQTGNAAASLCLTTFARRPSSGITGIFSLSTARAAVVDIWRQEGHGVACTLGTEILCQN